MYEIAFDRMHINRPYTHSEAVVVGIRLYTLVRFGFEQWLGFYDSNLAVNYGTFGSDRRKLVRNHAQ